MLLRLVCLVFCFFFPQHHVLVLWLSFPVWFQNLTGNILSVQPNSWASTQVGVGCVCCVWASGSERVCLNVCMRGVKPSPLSLADGHSEDGLTQEQWGPLTKPTPPRHVASYHRGNPPWDRERADSWRGRLTKMESISFHWSSLALYLFPLLPVFRYSRPLWMWVTAHFTAVCDWLYGLVTPPTIPPDKKQSKRQQ